MRYFLMFSLSIVYSICFAQSGSLSATVYISTGCEAYAYHQNRNCYSLSECNARGHVSTISRNKAISDKQRTPCGRCLKKEYKLWKEKKWLIRVNNKTIRKAQAPVVINYYKKHVKYRAT